MIRPRANEGTLLPALLATVLAGTLVLQFALVRSGAPDLETGPVARVSRSAPAPVVPAVVAQQVISDRPIFSPARVRDGGGGAAGGDLSGAQVSGSWSVGRRTNLVLRQPDGATRTIRVGQSINAWLLAAITPGGARFVRDGKSMLVPFGASAPAAAAQDDQKEENQ